MVAGNLSGDFTKIDSIWPFVLLCKFSDAAKGQFGSDGHGCVLKAMNTRRLRNSQQDNSLMLYVL
jgi:hypothetical protein